MNHQCPNCDSPNYISLQVLLEAGDEELARSKQPTVPFGIKGFFTLLIIGAALIVFRHPISIIIGVLFLIASYGVIIGRKKYSEEYLVWTRSYRCSQCRQVFELKNKKKRGGQDERNRP